MKLKIQISTNDKILNIPITSRVNPLGYDDSVENLVNAETNKSINKVSDAEVRRILPQSNFQLNFHFWGGFSYVTQVAPLEFSPTDTGTTQINSSFFIIQLYDAAKETIQNKKHTGYYNGYDFGRNTLSSLYTVTSDFEFSNLYISQDLLDSMSGLSTAYYAKFSFYSGKSGKFYSFSKTNPTITPIYDESLVYDTITINPNTMKYTFGRSPVDVYELTNAAYDALVNATVPSFPIEKTTYPTGNTFTVDGNYTTI